MFEYFNISSTLLFIVATILFLRFLISRKLILHSWFDPLTMAIFQTTFTFVALGFRIISWPSCLAFLLFVFAISFSRPKTHVTNRIHNNNWEKFIPWVLFISITANVILLSQKGFVFAGDDPSTARLTFYQGWGIFQRLNSGFSVVLGVYWAVQCLRGNGLKISNILILFLTVYMILTLGSKSGIYLLLTSIATASYFERKTFNAKQFSLLVTLTLLSSIGMFWLYYGVKLIPYIALRIISYADGPFYYFKLSNHFSTRVDYPFHQLYMALRLVHVLPEMSLGPRINSEYFSYSNELVGPNPQIFVEALAIFRDFFFLYYFIIAGLFFLLLRTPKDPYKFALFCTVAGPLLIDSQYAFSNLFNVALIFAVRGFCMTLRKVCLVITSRVELVPRTTQAALSR